MNNGIQFTKLSVMAFILSCLLLTQCTKKGPEEAIDGLILTDEIPDQIIGHTDPMSSTRLLVDIPEHILEMDSLKIFNGDEIPRYTIELINDRVYDENGASPLTQIYWLTVDQNNRIIASGSSSTYEPSIHIYNQDGSYHGPLGRRGKGPGEYGTVVGLHAIGDKIMVLDFDSQRLLEFSSQDYSFSKSILLETWKSNNEFRFVYIWPKKSGDYLLFYDPLTPVFGIKYMKLQIMNNKGYAIDSVSLSVMSGYKIKVGQSLKPSMPVNFLGNTNIEKTSDDGIVTVFNREFLVKKYDANLGFQSAFYYPVIGTPFNLNEYVKQNFFSPKVQDIKKAIKKDDIEMPKTFPVVEQLKTDTKKRVWVALLREELPDYLEWWILDETGELLAKIILPESYSLLHIGNEHLYLKIQSPEFDSDLIVKYAMHFNKN